MKAELSFYYIYGGNIMGITNSNKQISTSQIDCGGTLKITLALSAAPDIASNPTDIVLVLDRSGSMTGAPLANMKTGADTFIDIIDEATDGSQDGTIGSGSRIGIVSFSDTAAADTQLITSVAALKSAVNGLNAGGSTNHADAFAKAVQLFEPASPNGRVIVMFTDGKTTSGVPPAPVAAAARASGIIIYCIGLVGDDGIDVSVLNDWATDPDASHSVIPPTKGTAMMVSNTALQWKIPELGVAANEGASLEFYVEHIGQSTGTMPVNASIIYTDDEGNAVTFPDPSVSVDCGIVVDPEPCPVPVELTLEGCSDSLVADLGDVYLESPGRIVQLDVTVKNVCPHKRVALAVILTEVDSYGDEHQRGLKTITVPAHNSSGCRDILVKCIKFILPEDLNVSVQNPVGICSPRDLKVRVFAHSIDTDFRCCEGIITV